MSEEQGLSTTATGGSVGPPLPLTIMTGAAAAVAVVAAILGATAQSVLLPAIGYVVGAVVGVVLGVLYRSFRDKRRSQSRGSFRANPLLDRLTQVSMGVGVVAGLFCAYLLATELAK